MGNLDQVLARIQSQLESMKKSLLHRRAQYSEVVRREPPSPSPSDAGREAGDKNEAALKNLQDRSPRR